MERPAKRIRLAPQKKSPFGARSRTNPESFTSNRESYAQYANDQYVIPTRTLSLSDFQRRAIFYEDSTGHRPPLQRRNGGIYLLPRAPDATVTANVVEINVNDGSSTTIATQISAASDATIVSLSDVGSLTIPGVTSTTSDSGTIPTDISQSISTSTTQTTGISNTASITSSLQTTISSNGTVTDSGSAHTVTVTSTSTFEVSYINGTLYTKHSSTTRNGGLESNSDINTSAFSGHSGIVYTAATSSASPTDFYGGGGSAPTSGGTPVSPVSSATSTSSSGSQPNSGNTGPGLTPQQQQVVGGVVGGVAGIAVVLLALLIFLRWYRRRLKSRGELPSQISQRNLTDGHGGSAGSMSQFSSAMPLASAFASSMKKFRPHSSLTVTTTNTDDTTMAVPESERGFQRIAGRKLAPVLSTGGDGYGGSYGAFEKDTLADQSEPLTKNETGLRSTSFYHDKNGFYGGKGITSPTLPSSPTTGHNEIIPVNGINSSMTRDFAAVRPNIRNHPGKISFGSPGKPEGMAVLRPSPARTPITLSPASSHVRLPIQQPPLMSPGTPPLPNPGFLSDRDAIGRSLASQDGSRFSGMSRSSGGKFVENLE